MSTVNSECPILIFTTRSVPHSRLVDRLKLQFSNLSLSERFSTPSPKWSRLESLAPELLILISDHLAFFDKKALASTSQRIYHSLGLVMPPDRFAWRVHLLTSFNRAPSDQFDVTIFPPEEIRKELTRLWRQIPPKPRLAHRSLDPEKSRLSDLNCLYFPGGFATNFRSGHIRCRTLGQFIAIQFNEYINTLVKTCKRGQSLVRRRRRVDADVQYTNEHKAALELEAAQWQEIHSQCVDWIYFAGIVVRQRAGAGAPTSTKDGSMELLVRTGYEFLCNRVCMYGRICEVGGDEGITIHRESKVPCRNAWYALDKIEEGKYKGDDYDTDEEGKGDNEVPMPTDLLY